MSWPDLTLSEVSEASEIIHGAAHEDANIIFGAVVDETMEGQVKITVIATGFDRERVQASPAAQTAKTTPVDMTAYATAKVQPEEHLAANGTTGRVVIARRPPVADLPVLPLSDPAATGDEEASPLDVPAFLRRN